MKAAATSDPQPTSPVAWKPTRAPTNTNSRHMMGVTHPHPVNEKTICLFLPSSLHRSGAALLTTLNSAPPPTRDGAGSVMGAAAAPPETDPLQLPSQPQPGCSFRDG